MDVQTSSAFFPPGFLRKPGACTASDAISSRLIGCCENSVHIPKVVTPKIMEAKIEVANSKNISIFLMGRKSLVSQVLFYMKEVLVTIPFS